MLKKRVIPVVLLRNGVVVQSKRFKRFQALGSPATIVKRLSGWAADELIYLDISSTQSYDLKRDDLNVENHANVIEILKEISRECFMPLTFGGGIRSLMDVETRIIHGADKVTLNTWAIEEPDAIEKCAREFGSQCVVVSIDVDLTEDSKWRVVSHRGTQLTELCPISWTKEVASRGAGEVLINTVYNDGVGSGYDIQLIKELSSSVNIPVIALGGVGSWDHFLEALEKSTVSAVAAANIFNYSENSVYNAKKFLFDHKCNVRHSEFLEILNSGES